MVTNKTEIIRGVQMFGQQCRSVECFISELQEEYQGMIEYQGLGGRGRITKGNKL